MRIATDIKSDIDKIITETEEERQWMMDERYIPYPHDPNCFGFSRSLGGVSSALKDFVKFKEGIAKPKTVDTPSPKSETSREFENVAYFPKSDQTTNPTQFLTGMSIPGQAEAYERQMMEAKNKERRERIATACLQGLLAWHDLYCRGAEAKEEYHDGYAEEAVCFADALIKRLEEK